MKYIKSANSSFIFYLESILDLPWYRSWGLQVKNVMSPRKLHGLRLVDLSPVLQVLLVPQEDDDGVPPAVELQLKEPVLQPGEGAPVSQIKDQHSALGPSEVSLGDGAEPGE